MTPKEKAKQLYDKFKEETDGIAGYNYDSVNIECALIAVNEILEDREEIDGMRVINDPYWLEVKKEIESFKLK
jgi:translation elongation factor EF-4